MSNVSNDQIYSLLCNVHQSIGAIEGKVDSQRQWMTAHAAEDKLMAADIKTLQLNHAKTRGSVRTWGMVGTAMAAVAGVATSFLRGH